MSDNVFSAYLSVKVAEKHNTEEFMEAIILKAQNGNLPCLFDMDKDGDYGLRYDLVDEDSDLVMDYSFGALLGAQKMLEGYAKNFGVEINGETWKVQAAYWYNGVDYPLTF